MSDVAKLGQGLHLSISTLAAEFGMTRETVSKRLADAAAVPSGKRGGYPVYRLKDVYQYLVGDPVAPGDDPRELDPYRRQAHYKAELDRLKLEQETRELIPRIEVEQEEARILRVVALWADTAPDILERDCGLTATQIARVERSLDEMREALFAELAEGDDAVRESA